MFMQHNTRNIAGPAPTIADVADHSGFSPSTVSRVINDDKNVKLATRNAVRASLEQLNYIPNLAARSLAGTAQIRIGLLYSNPSAAYLSRLLLGCLEQSRLNQVQLIIENCSGERDALDTLYDLIRSGVDGILLCPPLCDDDQLLSVVETEKVPTVVVANWTPPGNISTIRINDFAAAKLMTHHIVNLGHKRIGFIEGDAQHKASEQRLLGFQAAMKEAGVNVDFSLIVEGEFTYRSGLHAAEKLLGNKNRPTAIFAANDDMAAAAVTVAHRMRLNVPRDLTICGFDDTDFAQSIWPELTTIHQPISAMAGAAVTMLYEKVRAKRAGKPDVRLHELLEFTLIQRGSDAAPAVE
jgi:LacI family transcriptional regulator